MTTNRSDQVEDWITEASLEDPVFVRLREAAPEAPTSVLLREYASMRWLRQNAPNYADVVKVARHEVKEELRALATRLAPQRP